MWQFLFYRRLARIERALDVIVEHYLDKESDRFQVQELSQKLGAASAKLQSTVAQHQPKE